MTSQTPHYRSFLKEVLAERQKRNPSYSMRAFAQKIGITQAAVSQIFSGKRGLSLETASKIARNLELSSEDSAHFLLMVQLESSKEPQVREVLLRQLQALHPERQVHDLSIEAFRCIADWYHLALRNLIGLDDFRYSPQNAAKRLGITPIEAELAIDRLLRLELIEPDPKRKGNFRKTQDSVLAKSAVTNGALRRFHKQMLEKAIESLETQTPHERLTGSETFAFSPDDLPQANRIIEEFFSKMVALNQSPKKKTRVYHLGVQFFDLTHAAKRNKREKTS